MIEPTGCCPLCNEDFGGEDAEAVVCPGCGIILRKHVPFVRVNRSWFWEFTDESIAKLLALWLGREAQ